MAIRHGSPLEVLRAFFRLGLTSFGGPVAHIGYFRAEFVERRRWVSEQGFADLFALCQFMPGPASSQLGMALGLLRAGPLGMLCAWIGFTLPSALLMAGFAYGIGSIGNIGHARWLEGLKLVAVAVVSQAVWNMARSLCPDRERATLAVVAALICLVHFGAASEIGAIVLGAVVGLAVLKRLRVEDAPQEPEFAASVPRIAAVLLLAAFIVLLVLLSAVSSRGSPALQMMAAFYRAGALVFGGGHVVLPLLQSAVVPPGWVSNNTFLAGYGAAQALPGPLFTFAAFLGASMRQAPTGWLGALLATIAIFFPSFLLVGGLLPFWDTLRQRPAVQSALRGVNAAVVGILLAALYAVMWAPAVTSPASFGLALAAFLLLVGWAVPPWAVVLLGAGVAQVVL
jgi:chromate transporter